MENYTKMLSRHAQNFFVKSHTKYLIISVLPMHGFLEGIFGLFGLNEFWRLVAIDEFIVKKLFEVSDIIRDISFQKLVNFECKYLL